MANSSIRKEVYNGLNIGDFEEKLTRVGGKEVPYIERPRKIYHMVNHGHALIDYTCIGNSLAVNVQGKESDVYRLEKFILGLTNTRFTNTLFP